MKTSTRPQGPADWPLTLTQLAAALLALALGMPGTASAQASSVISKAKIKVIADKPTSVEAGDSAETKKPGEAAEEDPLLRLRERLAGRLAVIKAGATSSALDVPSSAKPQAPSAPKMAARSASADKPKAPNHGNAHWGYSGDAGPQSWGGLRADFSLCGSGQRQSPIDIRDGFAVELEPVKFDYRPVEFSVIDNGHTVQANLAAGNSIELSGRRYELKQFHFHRPSEERIDGRQFEMDVHLVHKDADGRLAVVAVLLERGAAQSVVQMVWNNLPLEKRQEQKARVNIDVSQLLPTDRRYYTYMGSLTTPPCTEGVQWVVMRHPVAVSEEQIDLFSRLYPMNARPAQSASGRRILQSN